MLQFYSIIALDLAREREHAARHDHLVDLVQADVETGRNGLRHGLAASLALVSKGSAAAVRRLDDCVADDLTEALVAGR